MPDALLSLLDDLAAEHEALDAVVEGLRDDAWDIPTPSPGWRVRDQIGHLAFFDQQGYLSASDPDAFLAETAIDLSDLTAFEWRAGRLGREFMGLLLLAGWRTARAMCLQGLAEVPEGVRMPWYGPPMSVRSFATARLMETWAHGQDVVDGLGLTMAARPATDRLRHVAFIGASTRGWSYTVRGREVPAGDVRVELSLPSGASWSHGPEAAGASVRGSVLDFCMVVTQRRNAADTALVAEGALAEEWLSIAQCFAGAPTLPPTAGRSA
jgi:uncharacterized protein (TIGR03084 family)